MANINISRGNTLPDSASKSDFHNLIDLAVVSISNISDSDVGVLTSANKVAGSALYNLYSILSGASIPAHALQDIEQLGKVSAYSLYNLNCLPSLSDPIETANSISAQALKNMNSLPSTSRINGQLLDNLSDIVSSAGQMPYVNLVSSIASGGVPAYDGSSNFVGININDVVDNSGLSLISTTALSTATNSGDISISPSKIYKVFIEVTDVGFGTTSIYLRFNSDSTATNYDAADGGGTQSGQIDLTGGLLVKNGGSFACELTIDTRKRETDSAFVLNGRSLFLDSADSNYTTVDNIKGVYLADTTITDFEILTAGGGGGNLTGNIKVYELSLS